MWNDHFNEFISRCGFRRCKEDSCLYVRVGKSGPVYPLLHVYDVLIIAKNLSEVKTVKRMLRMEFKMQDLGEAQMFLALRIDRDRAKPSSTPMEPRLQLKKEALSQSLEKPYKE